MKLNATNERIKHQYFAYLKDARQLDGQSVDAVAAALDRFEIHTRRRDFRKFRPEQASAFKADLLKQRNRRTDRALSKATLASILAGLKAFFFWLAGQPGYKAALRYDWSDYFNPSLKDLEVAKARRSLRVPTLDQVHVAIAAMPTSSPVEKRDRALLAIIILTGARDNAVASMRLKHIDLDDRVMHQDGRDVRTKFGKTFETWFFPVGADAEIIVSDWVAFLKTELGFGPDDPMFPATRTGFDATGLPVAPTLGRECWSTATPIRKVFQDAFARAKLPYFNPHSFRNTLTRLGMELCAGDAVALKAWSQNLGHDDVLTTLTSYGEVPAHQQRDLILSAKPRGDIDRLIALGRMADAALKERLS